MCANANEHIDNWNTADESKINKIGAHLTEKNVRI
jgi:hypothetical protein